MNERPGRKICKVPQHIERDVIDIPEKKIDGKGLNDTDEELEKTGSDSVTNAPEIEDVTTMAVDGTKDEATVVAARVIGNQKSATENPTGNTVWTQVTRWGWKLVLKTCNFHYILLINIKNLFILYVIF